MQQEKNKGFSWEFLDVMNTVCIAEAANVPTLIQQQQQQDWDCESELTKTQVIVFFLSLVYNKSIYCAIVLRGKPGQMIFQFGKLKSFSIQTHVKTKTKLVNVLPDY